MECVDKNCNDSVKLYEFFSSSILKVASELGILKRTKKFDGISKPWFGSSCLEKRRKLRAAARRCSGIPFDSELATELVSARSEYRAILNKSKKDYYSKLKSDLANPKSPVLFWKSVRALSGNLKSNRTAYQLSMDVAYNHLSGTFSRHNEPFFVPRPLNSFDPTLDRDFSEIELDIVLQNLKLKKAPGIDGLPNELYKCLCPTNRLFLLNIFNRVFIEGVPAIWS